MTSKGSNTGVLIFSNDASEPDESFALMGKADAFGLVEIEKIEQNLVNLQEKIDQKIMPRLKESRRSGLCEVSISLGLNAKGSIGILGIGSEISGNASITLKYLIE